MRHLFSSAAILLSLAASSADAADFRVSLPGHESGSFAAEEYFDGFGCAGVNRSPEIVWSGAPADAKSFVVTVYDPDAPTGSGWWHWIAADLPAGTTRLPAHRPGVDAILPKGAIEIRNDYGKAGWGGPCPPVGEVHRYEIAVTALKVDRLPLPADPSAALVGYLTRANALATARATLLGRR